MSSIWIPALLALAAGLVGGAFLAWRLRRAAAAPARTRQLELQVADLEARRDDLYRRLRGEEAADPAERRQLELDAARVLRELETKAAELAAEGGQRDGDEAKRPPAEDVPGGETAAPAAAARAPATGGFASRHPLLVGFLSGASMVALVAVLVYWAVRDAAPRPDDGGVATSGEMPADHPPVDEVPAEMAARIAEVEARLAADPEDLAALKELALLQLSAGDFFEAFRASEELLSRESEDPDGLFVQGVVRVSMGQSEMAIDLLDRVLARFPQHLQAMVYRGIALYQLGEVERAVDTWEVALEGAGGRNAQIEQLLAEVRSAPPPAPPPAAEAPAFEDGEASAAATTPPAAAPAPAGPAAPPPSAAAAGAVYRATLELGAGLSAPPGAVLFVFLRPAPGAPPVAVSRVEARAFPMEVTLGGDDAMMGGELPASGILSARLDADGSASTRDPGDLSAEREARVGEVVLLTLER